MPYNPKSLQNLSKTGPQPGVVSFRKKARDAFVQLMEMPVGEDGRPFLNEFLQNLITEAREKPNSKASMFLAERLFEGDILNQIEAYLNRGKSEDTDFLSYRLYRRAFNIQKQILGDTNLKIVLMAGRRAGKTNVLQKKVCDVLATKERARVLYVAKTLTAGLAQMWSDVRDCLDSLGIEIPEARRNEGNMKTAGGAEFFIRGNTTVEDREKLRGEKWDLAIVDEAQSQAGLVYLVESILEPALLDRKGQLILAGTGPRVRGTYFEALYTNDNPRISRYNWNMSANPHMPDYEKILETIREEKGLSESSPLYVREYLGKIAYDDDALVYRLGPGNYYTPDELRAWCNSQPPSDLRLTAGLDYGFSDADGFAIVLYSISKPERFLLCEYKGRRQGISELVNEIKKALASIGAVCPMIPERDRMPYIFADSGGGGKKISFELATQYGLPAQDAYKQNKDLAIELLQDEIRGGRFKVPKGGAFDDEALRTVFARNDRDELTRTVDDETYHPDLLDAVLYAMRPVWLFDRKENR